MKRLVFETEHEQLRSTARDFIEREIKPYAEAWERDGQVDREVYKKGGDVGLSAHERDR